MEGVTIRKVADKAGYNSATLYNYFDDLDHLILFSSLKYLKDYNYEVVKKLKNCKEEKKIFYMTWEEFCKVSFKHPEAFYKIFFNKHSAELDGLMDEYYGLFPEEKETTYEKMMPVFSNFQLMERNIMVLRQIFKVGEMPEDKLNTMNELMIGIYKNLLENCIANKKKSSIKEYTKRMFTYIDFIINK